MLAGYRWAQEQRQRELTQQAWLIAALSRQKKLPELERLLAGKRPDNRTPEERRQDWEELKRRLT